MLYILRVEAGNFILFILPCEVSLLSQINKFMALFKDPAQTSHIVETSTVMAGVVVLVSFPIDHISPLVLFEPEMNVRHYLMLKHFILVLQDG
jgi:hypothetical protein